MAAPKMFVGLRMAALAIYILALIWGTSLFVGLAARHDLLVWAALPLPLIPILGLHFLRPNEKLAGWSAFTVWLGSTYAMSGHPSELFVFGLISISAVAGYYRSPWFLVGAWFFHIAWDFVPRELPDLMRDLPLACMIFDGLIGAYLAGMTATGRLARTDISENMEAKI